MHRNEWNRWHMSYIYSWLFPPDSIRSVNINELQLSNYFINLFELVMPRKIFIILNVDIYKVE